MQTTTYFNGTRYVRDDTHRTDMNGPYRVHLTFAYQGSSGEWPTVLTYVLR